MFSYLAKGLLFLREGVCFSASNSSHAPKNIGLVCGDQEQA